MGGATKSTFISLIPKDSNPTSIKRIWPMSLYNALQLFFQNSLPKTKVCHLCSISLNQGGFNVGHYISDNIILIHKAIHSSIKRREAGMDIKLDLANAFDFLRNDFIFFIMEKYGFSPFFIK